MLVLSRKLGEQIMIGPNIVLVVVGMSGDRVKLGIEAPRDVPIYREEVLRRIQHEQQEACAVGICESEFHVEFA